MTMNAPGAPREDPTAAAVARVIADLKREAFAGSREATQALIDGAFDLLDRGLTSTAMPALEALDDLRTSGLLTPGNAAWLLNLHARKWFAEGNLEEALAALHEAMAIAADLGDRALTATTLLNIGNVQWLRGDPTQAEVAFRSSFEARPPGDDFGRAQALLNLAGLRLEAGDVEGARTELVRAAGLVPTRRGRLRASVAGIRGLIAVAEGDLVSARTEFRESANVAARVRAFDHLVVALQNLGAVNLDLGHLGVAMRSLRRAERIAAQIGHSRLLDSIQRTLATALQKAGRNAEARTILTRAEDLARLRGDRAALARILSDSGSLWLLQRRYRDGVLPLAASVATFVELRDSDGTTVPLINLATALTLVDDEARAVEEVDRAAARLELSPAMQAEIAESIGDALLAAARPDAAARAYQRGASLVERADLPVRDYLAQAAARIGDELPAEGVRFYAAALAALRPPTTGIEDYHILNDRALLLAILGRVDEALADLRDALERATSADDRAMRLMVLGNLSEVLRRSGQLDEATEVARTAVDEARRLGSRQEVASSLATLGLAIVQGDAWQSAEVLFDESLKLARALGADEIAAIALGGIAEVHFRRRWFGRSRIRYRQAAALERGAGDRAHLLESQAAIVETDALLGDREGYDQDLQVLVDLVQKDAGSLDVAQTGMSRAARAWSRRGPEGLFVAGETFGIALLLALWGLATSGSDEPTEEFGRAFVAPYAYLLPSSSDRLDQLDEVMLRTVEEKAGRRARRFARQILGTGRAAALAAFNSQE